MSKTIILVHGRHFKPAESVLTKNWTEALRHGIQRDEPNAVEAFDAARIEMIYYGDVSNEYLSRVVRERYDENNDIEDRKLCLDELKTYRKSQFSERTYRRLPGASRWREGLADIFAGPLSILGLSDRAINMVAPDMAEYWDDATAFGSRVRAPMVRPLIEAFERNDEICVIAHSLGSLIAYDTFWKFSHMSEYRGSISPDLDFEGKVIDLWITIGSPLSDETVKRNLKGSGNTDIRRYPTNIRRWINFAAEDDFISHDEQLANDYEGMITLGPGRTSSGRLKKSRTKISDVRMYNLSVRGRTSNDAKSNPHHGTGYLISPQVAKAVAEWVS
ncbi:hypothetical protein [Roseiconus lacunae]|uniref:Alpha/beta hydrolase n=1 Tax=Roseiconus lacunae TaxID=2605694 RepID=A0ABT7PS84_9BACT|nr:hypothetical protein [Roseiconus lacunae]MDM4019341.1 hypothetical protein [Roseiconus lacunae]